MCNRVTEIMSMIRFDSKYFFEYALLISGNGFIKILRTKGASLLPEKKPESNVMKEVVVA